ncbi:RNA polymerase sigma factor [Tolypothrix sp. VBCCA 56010]|uniref:RNA polymerase sigma factor n=1 Tax=Tolypothrix sp. VBCCA 56010 TaxID=3137731 RepID=UPI003D7E387C
MLKLNTTELLFPDYSTNWDNQQQHIYKVNHTMDELDSRLEHLALTAKQFPPKSQERQLALGQLASKIQKSGRLFCKGRYSYPEDVYSEALQETWLYVSRKIEKYDPEFGTVIAWVNFILHKRFIDAIRRYQKNKQVSLDEPIEFSGESGTTLLDTIPQPQILPDGGEILQEILQSDPDDLFKQEHIKNHPEANFQAIALRRLTKQSWNNMSAEWKVGVSTLSSFYQRCLKYFIPKIQEYYHKYYQH